MPLKEFVVASVTLILTILFSMYSFFPGRTNRGMRTACIQSAIGTIELQIYYFFD